MGTRGCLSFIINGKKRGFYNSSDSFQSGLGAAVVLFILLLDEGEWDNMHERLERIVWKNKDATVSKNNWSHFVNLGLADTLEYDQPRQKSWQRATNGGQGGVVLPHILSGAITALPDDDFEKEIFMCEYSYRVDFKNRVFVYPNGTEDGRTKWTFDELREADGYWYKYAMGRAIKEMKDAWTYTVLSRIDRERIAGRRRHYDDEYSNVNDNFFKLLIPDWKPDEVANQWFRAGLERFKQLSKLAEFGWMDKLDKDEWVEHRSARILPDDDTVTVELGLPEGSFVTLEDDSQAERWRKLYRSAGVELETILEKNMILERLGTSWFTKISFEDTLPRNQAERGWTTGRVPRRWFMNCLDKQEDDAAHRSGIKA